MMFYPTTHRQLSNLQRGHDRADVDEEREPATAFTQLERHHLASAQFLFDDIEVWTRIARPLAQMRIGEICELVGHLKIAESRIAALTDALVTHNLNGVALQTCELADLRSILELPLGDWTQLKLLIEALRGEYRLASRMIIDLQSGHLQQLVV